MNKLFTLTLLASLVGCGPPPLTVDPLTTIDLQRAQKNCLGGDEWAYSQVPQRQAKADAEAAGQPWDSEDPRHPWGIGGGTYVYVPHYVGGFYGGHGGHHGGQHH